MVELRGPYEFWDLDSGETREIRITGWGEGDVLIRPRYPGAPPSKVVESIRLYLAPGVKPHLPAYWDITSKHLITALKGYLTTEGYIGKTFIITKFGEAPRARFSLEVRES